MLASKKMVLDINTIIHHLESQKLQFYNHAEMSGAKRRAQL